MRFLGVDLGWRTGPSGLCCLAWQGNALELVVLDRRLELEAVLAWVDEWALGPAMVAVDAPTLIPNPTGMRLPDRLTHRYFGAYHAGCYPANLGRPFAARTVALGRSLEERGFEHAPQIVPQQPGRYQIEVFPHPAQINLFGLERILKYKKGPLAARRRELNRLRDLLLEQLPHAQPPLNLEYLDPVPVPGAALKALEDQLDAVVCAYVAAHWWYWGQARNLVLGDRETGYIVIPGGYPGGGTPV